MKLLITGGLGFQGSHLAEHFLKKGHQVTVLNTLSQRAARILHSMAQKPVVVWGSVTDYEVVRKAVREHDTVFHLAAYVNVDESLINPRSCFEVNVLGTVNVLEAARECRVRVIYASTCEVYGASFGEILITEETELKPHSPYASSKAAADRICFSYFKSYGLDVAIVRPFNVFGPRQKEEGFGALIPVFVRRALNKENLAVFGSGEQTRDYMYITDLVSAYDLILRTKKTAGRAYNFATGIQTSVRDIAQYIAGKCGVAVEYQKPRSGEVMAFLADTAHSKKLGFAPRVALRDGINRYIAWRKKQRLFF